jgi:hypothetical protein
MTKLLIAESFAISIVRRRDDYEIYHYNAIIELGLNDEDGILLATEIFDRDLYDCCLAAARTALNFAGAYVNEIMMFECDGTPIRDTKVPYTVEELVDALDDPDMYEERGDVTLH